MNAVVEPVVSTPRPVPHKTQRFRWLLQREFWEHKGGFFWAPMVAGAISLLLTLMAIVIAEISMRKSMPDDAEITLNSGERFQINGLDLSLLSTRLGQEELRQLGAGLDLSLIMASSWPFIVLAFVMFFYCLGALYDERKDRSVLFWKSLPLSDRDTVLSKVVTATIVAPLVATVAAIITMFGFLAVISGVVLLHGGNPVTLLWGPSSPLTLAAQYVAAIPVYALWAMPTVGWLMLCSAWAKSKPFLWAIMIPLFTGLFVAWFQIMGFFGLDSWWFFKNIVLRMLTSVFPLTWMDMNYLQSVELNGPEAIKTLLHPAGVYRNLTSANLWIGVAAGAAMIFAAIRLRRWRDEG